MYAMLLEIIEVARVSRHELGERVGDEDSD
jgi:hypothetical protein